MKRILIFAGAGLALLLVIIAALPFFIPASVYKTQIEKAASNALGRPVSVEGDARISVFPVISASVEDVRVANADGFDEEDMIAAGALRGSVRLWPLFSRRVEIAQIAFEDATVRLTRLEDGSVNWQLGEASATEARPDKAGADPFSASIDTVRLTNAALIYDDRQSGTRYELSNFSAETSLKSADRPMTLRANGDFQNESFEVSLTLMTPATLMAGAQSAIDVRLGSDLGNLSFDGNLTNNDAMSVNGRFSANIPQLAAIASFLDIELPVNAAPLGGLRANGSIKGALQNLGIEFEELALSGDGLSATYNGSLNLAAEPSFDGEARISVRDAHSLSEQLGMPLPALQAVKQLSIDTRVVGPLSKLELSGINAHTSSPLLTASFSGLIGLEGSGLLDGDVSIKTGQLRQLLTQLGMVLPDGDNMKAASITGHAVGNFQNPGIQNGSYAIDETKATGSISANLQGAKPSVKADLKAPLLDLSPFLGKSSEPSSPGQEAAWSDTPLDLEALNLVDANLVLAADEIKIGNVVLTNSDLGVSLKGGRLNADLNRFTAFGGNWQGRSLIDASAQIPAFDFEMAASSVLAKDLLSGLAGFDRLSGNGNFSVDLSSTGASVSQIIDAVDGTLSLDLDSGTLAGINLGQLVRSAGSLSATISSGELSLKRLGDVVSPQAQTDFTDFTTVLDLQDGLARISSLSLANSVLEVTGAGQINLAGRTLDLKLTPGIDKTAQGQAASIQINGIPVPLRVHGSWSSPKFTPDFSGVQAALTESARGKAAAEIKDRIGGDLGAIASDVISGRKPGADTSSQEAAPAAEAEAAGESEEGDPPASDEEDAPPEDAREQAIKDVLGSIFGPN